MELVPLSIPEVKLARPDRHGDRRGFFQQTYHREQYIAEGIEAVFVQDNWSRSRKGVLRGLHYQLENPQAKLVTVIRGRVFDVAVDIRLNSPTFGKWAGEELSGENGCQLYVPRGFAHGFAVLSDEIDFIYKCDNFYVPDDEYGIFWDDPDIGIEWPSCGTDYVLSDKDSQLPMLADQPRGNLPVCPHIS